MGFTCQLFPNLSRENCPGNSTVLMHRMNHLLSWSTLTVGLQTILFFTSAATNCFVLLVISKHKTFKGSNLFVLNLVIGGTLTTFTMMPTVMVSTYMNGWLGSEATCSVYSSLVTVLTSCMSITLLCITLDRYYALTYPLAYKSKATTKKIQLATLMTWIVSIVVALIPILTKSRVRNTSGVGFCFPEGRQHTSVFEKSYISVVVIGLYVIPSCILAYTNVLIFIKTRAATANRRMFSGGDIVQKLKCRTDSKKNLIEMDRFPSFTKQKKDGYHSGQKEKSKMLEMKKTKICVHKDNRKAARMLFVCIFSFLFCNGPFYALLILYISPGGFTIPPWIESIAVLFLFINPIINPFIYVFRNVCVKNLILRNVPHILRQEEHEKLETGHRVRRHFNRAKKSKVKGEKRPKKGIMEETTSYKDNRQETTIVFHTETKGIVTVL